MGLMATYDQLTCCRIRNSLESHHELESEAAVYAIDNLCSFSGFFCEGVIDKLSTLIQGEFHSVSDYHSNEYAIGKEIKDHSHL